MKELSSKISKDKLEKVIITKLGISNFHINDSDDINAGIDIILQHLSLYDHLDVSSYSSITYEGQDEVILFKLGTSFPHTGKIETDFIDNIKTFNKFIEIE